MNAIGLDNVKGFEPDMQKKKSTMIANNKVNLRSPSQSSIRSRSKAGPIGVGTVELKTAKFNSMVANNKDITSPLASGSLSPNDQPMHLLPTSSLTRS